MNEPAINSSPLGQPRKEYNSIPTRGEIDGKCVLTTGFNYSGWRNK
jgi:hypothetical protein